MAVCRVLLSRWAWRGGAVFQVPLWSNIYGNSFPPSSCTCSLLGSHLVNARTSATPRHRPTFHRFPCSSALRCSPHFAFATERDVSPPCLRAAPLESLAAFSPLGKKKRRSVQERPALRIRLLFIYRLHKQVNTGGVFLSFARSRVSRSVAAESSPVRVHARSEALQFSIS